METIGAYRYFLIGTDVYGPYKVQIEDPSGYSKNVKFVKCHYEEAYLPVRGSKYNVPRIEGEVRSDGESMTLWLREADDEKAVQLFKDRVQELADYHFRMTEKAERRWSKIGKTVHEPKHIKPRKSDNYILYTKEQ